MSDGRVWVFHNMLSYWDFHAQPFLGFTKNAINKKYPACGSPVDAKGQRRMG